MLVQDPLSGYLHEVPDMQPYFGGYGGGYYGGYDEYVDPSMAEYPGELGHLGFLFLPKIISAITGRGRLPLPSLPPLPPLPSLPSLPQPAMTYPPGAGFAPSLGMRAYIASVVRDVLAQTGQGVNPVASQGGFRRRRRRR